MSLLSNLDVSDEANAANAARQLALEKRANGIFIASLISILFCCLGGLISSYIAYGAKNDAAAGDLDLAERRINIATGLMIAAYILGILAFLGRLAGNSNYR